MSNRQMRKVEPQSPLSAQHKSEVPPPSPGVSSQSSESNPPCASSNTSVDGNMADLDGTFNTHLKELLYIWPMDKRGFEEECGRVLPPDTLSWEEFQKRCDDKFMPTLKTLLEKYPFTHDGFRKACPELQNIDSKYTFGEWNTFERWADRKFRPVLKVMDKQKLELDEDGFASACGVTGISGEYQTFKEWFEKVVNCGPKAPSFEVGWTVQDVQAHIDAAMDGTEDGFLRVRDTFRSHVEPEIGQDRSFKYRIVLMAPEDDESDDYEGDRYEEDCSYRKKPPNIWLPKDTWSDDGSEAEEGRAPSLDSKPDCEEFWPLSRVSFALHANRSPRFFGFQLGYLERRSLSKNGDSPTNWADTGVPVVLKIDRETYKSKGVYLINPSKIKPFSNVLRRKAKEVFDHIGLGKDVFCVCIAECMQGSEQREINWGAVSNEKYSEGRLEVGLCLVNPYAAPPTLRMYQEV